MEFSFFGIRLSIGLTFLLLITAIILLIVASIYLKTSDNTLSSTIVDNNNKAFYFFIGAIISLIIFIFINILVTISIYNTENNKMVSDIKNNLFGFGTYFLLSLNVILMIATIVLIFLGYSYVEASTSNTHGELIRTLALSSGIMTAILLLPLIYMFYIITSYNSYYYIFNDYIKQIDVDLNKVKQENKFIY